MADGGAGIQESKGDGREENVAAWLVGIKNLKIQPYNLPPLGPHDVKVRIKALGICGSDVHHFKHMRCANFIVKKPMVIGHECAGIIEEVGSEVKNLAVGDRVALEPGISCTKCDLCKDGRYNLCRQMKFFGSPPTNGSLANKVIKMTWFLACRKYKQFKEMEIFLFSSAIRWCILQVCAINYQIMSAWRKEQCVNLSVLEFMHVPSDIGPETRVLIMGAGPIGLLTLLAARAFGAPRIVAVDVDACRLSIAKDLGADESIQVSTDMQDISKEVMKIQSAVPSSIDVSFDCVGVNKTMSTALSATRSGGKVCLIGLAQTEMTLPLTPAAARETDVIGIFRYRNTWPLCIEFLRTGKIDVKPLITHRFGFSQEDIEEAFKTSAGGGSAIKVMFNL